MQTLSSCVLIAVGFYLVQLNIKQWNKLDLLLSTSVVRWQDEFDLRICANLAAAEANLVNAWEILPPNAGNLRERFRALAEVQRDQLFDRYPDAPKPDHHGVCAGSQQIKLATSLHREDRDEAFSKANLVSRFTSNTSQR